MRITMICVGRLKAGPERELFERYFTRLRGMARSVGVADVDVREIDESRARRPEDRREEEASAILKSLGPRDALVALDERGASPSSQAILSAACSGVRPPGSRMLETQLRSLSRRPLRGPKVM